MTSQRRCKSTYPAAGGNTDADGDTLAALVALGSADSDGDSDGLGSGEDDDDIGMSVAS